MRDWHTSTVDAAEAWERGSAYEESRASLAEADGYNPDDDTLGTRLPLTDPAAFARACQGARAMRAAAEERDRVWRAAREAG